MSTSLREHWEKAALFCSMITETTGLKPVLDAAVQRGIKRDPLNHHVVVHPEYPWHEKALERASAFPDAQSYREKFHALMVDVFTKEKNVLVWQAPGARRDIEFPYADDRVVSTVDPALVNGSIQGMLDADGVDDALIKMKGIHPKDTFRISGAAMGHCPTQALVQLFALTYWKVLIPPGSKDSPERHHYKVMQEVLYQLKMMQGRCRFDVLHNTFFDRKTPEFTEQLGKYATIVPDPRELT